MGWLGGDQPDFHLFVDEADGPALTDFGFSADDLAGRAAEIGSEGRHCFMVEGDDREDAHGLIDRVRGWFGLEPLFEADEPDLWYGPPIGVNYSKDPDW
jgi:hypothetical protein